MGVLIYRYLSVVDGDSRLLTILARSASASSRLLHTCSLRAKPCTCTSTNDSAARADNPNCDSSACAIWHPRAARSFPAASSSSGHLPDPSTCTCTPCMPSSLPGPVQLKLGCLQHPTTHMCNILAEDAALRCDVHLQWQCMSYYALSVHGSMWARRVGDREQQQHTKVVQDEKKTDTSQATLRHLTIDRGSSEISATANWCRAH